MLIVFLLQIDRIIHPVLDQRMGIQGLSKLVADVAAHAIKENEIKNYFGRKIAIDASMSLYQFLIAIRWASQD